MKALVKTAARTMTMQDLPKPEADGQDVIVKVTHCGICGSDVHMWIPDDRLGLVFGHEFAGVVEDPGASKLSAGDRVVVIPGSKTPGHTMGVIGTNGAYAQYVSQVPHLVQKLPDTLDNEVAAMLEPLSISLNAVRRTHIGIKDKVLITGTGIIGLGCALWARLEGADEIYMTEVNPDKIAMIKAMGICDGILNARDPDIKDQLKAKTGGVGFDKVMECSGTESGMQLCIDITRREGQITYVGIDYHPIALLTRPIVANQLSVVGAYGGLSHMCSEIISHLGKNRLDPRPFVTSRIKLEDVQAKLEELASGKSTEIKSIIELD